MEMLVLAAVTGIPLAIALYVIDAIAGREPAWRNLQQLQTATGAFRDRPSGAGHRAPRLSGDADVEARPVPKAQGRAASRVASFARRCPSG